MSPSELCPAYFVLILKAHMQNKINHYKIKLI